jgi:vacuolar-type H+-ATPase subunit I/STV1
MKKFLMFIALAITLTACYTDEDKAKLQAECKALTQQKANLQSTISRMNDNISTLNTQINDLRLQKNSLETGREIKYIVKFRIKQSTFTLDIGEHIKNGMNAIELELPVSKPFYDRVSVGTEISKSFKMGSLLFNGDFSNLHMTVTGKRME